jgi:hypothetical protein
MWGPLPHGKLVGQRSHLFIRNIQPTKCTLLFLRYLYYNITLNIPTFFDPQTPRYWYVIFCYHNCRSTFHILHLCIVHLYILNEMFSIVSILIILMFLTLISKIQHPAHLCNYSTNTSLHFKYLTLLHHVTCV